MRLYARHGSVICLRHKVHTSKILEIAGNLPMEVEIVDTTEKVKALLPVLGSLLREAGSEVLVTRENVKQWTTLIGGQGDVPENINLLTAVAFSVF
ncbi:MAG: DUF190 domain-containing protein [Desulfobulbaceae bacterium]|nr:DUF190 domain-containing protein [Desulfobulbaceae bacterium]